MLWGAPGGDLEIRTDGGTPRLRGRFPYGQTTELAPGRFEQIAPRAFSARVAAGDDIHLLVAHDYAHPLASRSAGTLSILDTAEALVFDATVDPGTTWARDAIAAHASGLMRGLSPGFRVPAGGERIERRAAGLVRTITAADIFEVSLVTRPAYPDAQIEARSWAAPGPPPARRMMGRWR